MTTQTFSLTMDPSKTSFAKLEGSSNYRVWSMKMKAYLIAQDLWDVIDISPSKATAENLKSQNSKAVSLINFACEDHILQIIDPDDLAATIWKKLQKQFGYVGFSARHLTFQSLVSTHVSSCDSVEQYIDKFRTHINTLSQLTSDPLPQWLLLSILINNVGNQFEAWSQSIMQQIRTKTSLENSYGYFDEVIASLIDEARRVNLSHDITSETVMIARNGIKPKPICIHCRKIHKSDNCWERFPEKRPTARFSASNSSNSYNMPQEHTTETIAFLSQGRFTRQNTWIIDSGASQHMCNDRTQFTRFEQFSMKITVANNTNMNAIGKGDVKITSKDGYTFTLQNVLYVPELASNLLSVCYATRNPLIRFNILKNKSHILFDNKIIATALLRDSLLVLETIDHHAHHPRMKNKYPCQKQYIYKNYNLSKDRKTPIREENIKIFVPDNSKKYSDPLKGKIPIKNGKDYFQQQSRNLINRKSKIPVKTNNQKHTLAPNISQTSPYGGLIANQDIKNLTL